MSKEVKATPASAEEVMPADRLTAMLELLLKKEAALAAQEQQLAERRKAFDARQREASNQYTVARIEAQKNCKHLKGGASRKRNQQRDPNVYMHRFTDGKAYIKCNSCGAKWYERDTAQYLFRNDNAIPNWTRIGWAEAVAMLEESSNKYSSSEIFPRGAKATLETVPGADAANLEI